MTRRPRCAAPLLLLTVLAAGCDTDATAGATPPARTADSFCATYWQEKDAYLAKYGARSDTVDQLSADDPLAAFLVSVSSLGEALGDVVIIFDKLEATAPDEIQPDVASIRDSLQKSIDSSGDAVDNPWGALLGSLVQGLTTQGSWQRLGDYVVDTCGETP
ncbi:hypothetical protein ACFQ0K_12185 [Nocardioides caeni]|uniref:Lipoprotein n=1 Tax=Nocardioides caeni TaxID=574700 RepID=A0A4S8NLD5_9ACTN|nr:hypothetical protein [Nocardioides caeni]THV17803.1 hypothetical protein E9934_04885 [Nocardioides caeni]